MHSQEPPAFSGQQLVICQEQSEDELQSFETNLCLIASVVVLVNVRICELFFPMVTIGFFGKTKK
jgi:hypothetical protein